MGLKIRHDTAANWTTANPTLEQSEQGYETDTGKLKIGDGVTAWTSLAYWSGGGVFGNVTGQASSVDGEVALFSGTGGKTIKRATGSGIPKLTSGVQSIATAGTDYYNPGGTDVAVADGGTGASSASAARTNLGLVIGTNVQAWDADLDTWATKTPPSSTPVGTTDAQTITNKRRTPRVSTASSPSTLTPEIDTYDCFAITALANNLTIANHSSSTPADFEKIELRITVSGITTRTLTFGTAYDTASTVGNALPASILGGKSTVLGFEWWASLSKWVLVALAQG